MKIKTTLKAGEFGGHQHNQSVAPALKVMRKVKAVPSDPGANDNQTVGRGKAMAGANTAKSRFALQKS